MSPAAAAVSRWRKSAAAICLTLLGVLAPLAVVATWAHEEISETDRFVAAVAPLARDEAVQTAVSARLTEEIIAQIDVPLLTAEAIDALADRGLPPAATTGLTALSVPIAGAVESFVQDRVEEVLATEQFARIWEQAARHAHAQMVAVLTGESNTLLYTQDAAVQLDLSALVDPVRDRLLESGFTLASQVPDVTTQITVFEAEAVVRAQGAFRLLETLAWVLPVVALLALASAIAISQRRRRTLVTAGLVVAGSMLLLAVGLNVARSAYLDSVPTRAIATPAAEVVFDRLVGFMRTSLRALMTITLVVSAAAWLSGPDPRPTAVRQWFGRLWDEAQRGRRRLAGRTGRVGAFLAEYGGPVRICVLALAVVTYGLADAPTTAWTVGLVLVVAVALLLIGLLGGPDPGRPAAAAAPAPDHAPEPGAARRRRG